jgi:acetylornithine deacetylase/succinyl-diaminopimelate desuccinylase-like protein
MSKNVAPTLQSLKELFQQHKEQLIQDYFTLLRFESVSAEPQYRDQVLACGQWVADYLQKSRMPHVELWETSGYPVVFAQDLRAGPDKPTLLFYGHYDVQPVDPLDLWKSPPFEPTLRGKEVYARGAQDNKGQLFYTMSMIRLLLQHQGELPLNIKMCIEGEEENKSHGLAGILPSKHKELSADYLVIPDFDMPDPHTPAITLGVRGLSALTVELEGSNTDLHSGAHGGIVYNPNHALVELLAKTRDAHGKVTIPGFYNDVETLSKAELSHLNLDFDAEKYRETFGATPTGGEHAYPPLESNWLRPTLEVNGISGGYSGPGFKTVIPAKAMAKISCRLVPNQDPEKIMQAVADFLIEHCPKGLRITVTQHGGGKPARGSPQSKVVLATADAYEEVFEKKCQVILAGGSIPISADLAEVSGAQIAYMGTGLPDDQIHAPNEHFGLDRLEQGFLVLARMVEKLSEK